MEPTRFRSLPRPVRRALLAGLDGVVAAVPAKLADVTAHREAFKRLGERLHPHEYPRWPHAADVFAVARGEKDARSFDSHIEELLGMNDVTGATRLLTTAPGKLFRSLDRLLRACLTQEERDTVVAAAEQVAPQISGRVTLSVREHLHNRAQETGGRRVFVNRRGGAWVTTDNRPLVPPPELKRLIDVLDTEIRRRLPEPGHLLIDPDILDVALPLSGKATAAGFGVLPRGSLSPVNGELLRFFVYWKQKSHDTDYDLSALMLDAENRVSVATLLRGIVERDYLTVRYLTDLMADRATATMLWDGNTVPEGPVTYIGLERPDGLHPDSLIVTPENLRALIPG